MRACPSNGSSSNILSWLFGTLCIIIVIVVTCYLLHEINCYIQNPFVVTSTLLCMSYGFILNTIEN
jgi:hypothetical protein